MATNTWQSGSLYANRYLNEFTYDANGNILTQTRYNHAGTQIENLSYKYERDANGRLLRNRLYHVNETVSAGAFADDIDDQGVFTTSNINTSNNYGYDEEGRLIRDDSEDIQEIKWTVGSKVKEVIRSNGSPKKNLKFDYDAFGKRIAKHVYTSANVWESSTYYSYDATGNVMCIYEKKNDGAGITYHAAERFIYGSSRVGVNKERVELSGTVTVLDTGNYVHHIGKKQYELNNHLGNVLSTVSDRLIAKDWNNDNTVDSYKAEILSATDYTPFGVAMDGRSYSSGNSRYGFNGVEKLGEYAGDFYITDFRLIDSRLGRWLSIDPIVKPWESGYSGFSNNPIYYVDPSGLDPGPPDRAGNDDETVVDSDGTNWTWFDGQWNRTTAAAVIVDYKSKADISWTNYFSTWTGAQWESYVNSIYEAKLEDYNAGIQKGGQAYGIARGMYGSVDGVVSVPQEVKDRLLREANAEALPALKSAWAAEKAGSASGPSFMYYKALTVSSDEEGLALVSAVAGNVALQWATAIIPVAAGKLSSGGGASSVAKVTTGPNSVFSFITPKIAKQIGSRGWTKDLIHNTVNNPYTTRVATNKATGNAATAYFRKEGGYVVRDNVTGDIIQISNRLDPKWIPDPSIINPYIPR